MMFGLPSAVWEAIGYLGQALFTARFLVQWLASEKKGESVVPNAFWWLSVGGSAVLTIYAVALKEPVFLLVSLINGFLYARNLILIYFRREKPTSRRVLIPLVLAFAAFLVYAGARKLYSGVPMPWLILGFTGTACWSGRFVIQWYASERAGKSVMPRSFWYVGLAGALILLSYSVYRRLPVFILGYLFPLFPYLRNLTLIYRKEGAPAPIRWAERVWRGDATRRIAVVTFCLLLSLFMAVRMLRTGPGGEFERLHRAAVMTLRGDLPRIYENNPVVDPYGRGQKNLRPFDRPPTAAILFVPLVPFGPMGAAILWAVANALAFLGALALCRALTARLGARAAWTWLPALLVLRFGWDSLNQGEATPLVLLAALAGIYMFSRGEALWGALLAALATVFEPALLILAFVLLATGRWRALVLMLLFTASLVLLPAAIIEGPPAALELCGQAISSEIPSAAGGSVSGESLRSFCCRILDHAWLSKHGRQLDLSLDLLSRGAAEILAAVLSAALLLGLAFIAKRHRESFLWGGAFAALVLIEPNARQVSFLFLMLPAASLACGLGSGALTGRSTRIATGCLLGALVCAGLPSRGIVGETTATWCYALCASGVAALLLFAGNLLLSRSFSPPPEGMEG
jgi:lipid-A-disaccharide synthase-like uncharacterized protein